MIGKTARRISLPALAVALGAAAGAWSHGAAQVAPVPLDDAMAAGCDSEPFLAAVQAFLVADQAMRQREVEPGSPAYDEFMDGQGAPRLDRVFRAARDLHRNEMHDCQRLIVVDGDRRSLGPLVGIFPDRSAIAAPSPMGRVVAEVYNFTGEVYPPLGLTDGVGVHCLWMQGGPSGWQDALLFRPPAQDDAPDCRDAIPPAGATTLTTTPRTLGTGHGPNSYPATGRWMWRESDEVQFIGMQCHAAWCELTPAGVATDASSFATSEEIPGWFDQQYLSYMHQATLTLSGLMGTISPGPASKHADPAAQRAALKTGAQVAAVIQLDGNDATARRAIRDKLGFDPATMGPASGESVHMGIWMVTPPGGTTPREEWRAWTDHMTEAAARTLRPAVGVRHSGLGTVRWRWLEDDEGGWFPCFDGCCTWR